MVHTHTHPNQYVNIKILQCYGINGHTDRNVTANRPHIIIKNKKEKTCILINVAIPVDKNVIPTPTKKQLKYNS